MDHRDYVYLLLISQVPETTFGVCKLGMTNCGKYERIEKGYTKREKKTSYNGKQSYLKVLANEAVDRSKYVEELLKEEFKKHFVKFKGYEYFEGDTQEMLRVFLAVCADNSGVVPMDI